MQNVRSILRTQLEKCICFSLVKWSLAIVLTEIGSNCKEKLTHTNGSYIYSFVCCHRLFENMHAIIDIFTLTSFYSSYKKMYREAWLSSVIIHSRELVVKRRRLTNVLLSSSVNWWFVCDNWMIVCIALSFLFQKVRVGSSELHLHSFLLE